MRTTSRALWLYVLVTLVAPLTLTAACRDDPPAAVQRKALLRPDEVRRRRIDQAEQRRIFDAEGELIASGERVAGLEMPKGLKIYRELEREHYLEAPRITLAQLERYFAPRLVPTSITRTATSVAFEGAQIKDSPVSPLLTVRIALVTGTEPASDILLRQAAPPRVFPSEAESQRKLAERLKYMN